MRTDELIVRLSADAAPPPLSRPMPTLALGLGVGMLASFVIMVAWLGIRPDLAAAVHTAPFWMKFAYTALFAAAAFWLTERLSRPGARPGPAELAVAIVPLAIAAIAIGHLGAAPSEQRMHLVMGSSADVCPLRIVILSLPVFVGVFWALSKLAPTRLIVAGAAAGLLAGAAGAWIYAFHCDESAAPFVAIFYTLGIATVGLLGGIGGRFLLRW